MNFIEPHEFGETDLHVFMELDRSDWRHNMSKGEEACCCSGTTKESTMQVEYDKNVHTIAYHHPLKQSISLEGCSAFGGQGKDLNPVDLLAMGVGSCLLIVMGKTAEAENLDIVGAKADVSYDLVNYQVAAINIDISLPKKLAEEDQAKLEKASKKCPVYLAIHPSVAVKVNYCWPE